MNKSTRTIVVTTSTPDLYSVLDGKQNLLSQVSEQRAKIALLTEQTAMANSKAESLTAQRKAWQIALDRNERTIDGLRLTADQVETLRLQAVAAGEEWQRLELATKQANKALVDLDKALQEFRPAITPAMVLLFQDDLAQSKNEVALLDVAILRQEAIITEAQSGITTPPDLQTERENLMAEIACGTASGADLQLLDNRIKEARQSETEALTEAEAIIIPARQTITGLTRKRDDALRARNALLARQPEVLRLLLQTEAERIGKEYVKLSDQVGAKYRQLLALDNLLGDSTLRGYTWQNLCHPSFKVSAMKDLSVAHSYNMLCDVLAPNDMAEAQAAERARLSELGINL